jgi:hypothetical protein
VFFDHELVGGDVAQWDKDADEIWRSRDRVVPPFELRFATEPTGPQLDALARAMQRGVDLAVPVLWSGRFAMIGLAAKSAEAALAGAPSVLAAIDAIAPLDEVLFQMPHAKKLALEPGPDWPVGGQLRPRDRALPRPQKNKRFEKALDEVRADAVIVTMPIIAHAGAPTTIAGLSDALAKHGVDVKGGVRVLPVLRWKHAPPAFHLIGLVADGRWALATLAFAEYAELFLPAHPPSEFRERLEHRLTTLGLGAAVFPEKELLSRFARRLVEPSWRDVKLEQPRAWAKLLGPDTEIDAAFQARAESK